MTWRWCCSALVGLVLIFLASPITAYSFAPASIRFERLTVDQGLSNSEIMTILQDRDGFLWFGTQNGLNRYDGYNVTVFRHHSDDPYSISGNVVLSAAESADGTLWFGTDSGGVNRYDKASGQFTAYQHDPDTPSSISNDSVWSLLVDREGYVWAGTRNGLNRLNPETGQFITYHPNPGDERPLAQWVLRIYEDHSGELWVGTRLGLNRLDRDTGQFTVYRPDPEQPGTISNEQAWAIYEDSQNTLWIGTRGGGLNRFDRASETFTAYRNDPADPNSLSHNTVWDILETPSGGLWIGTENGGLNLFDPTTETFTAYRNDPNDPYTISSNDVFRLVIDRSGVLWAGSRVGGVNKLYPALQRFSHYRHIPGGQLSLSVNYVSGILVDRSGELWVGTRGGGLNRIDRQNGHVTVYRNDPSDPQSLSNDYIYNLYQDEEGLIWLTTSGGGLNRLDPRTGAFQVWKSDLKDPESLLSNYLNVMLPAGDGQFWVGTLGFGLERFDLITGKAIHYRHNENNAASLTEDTINALLSDGQGGLWVGTFRGGLDHFNPDTGKFTHYRHDPHNTISLSDNNVQSLAYDRMGALWVGTLDGLNRFDPKTQSFKIYRTADGLPNESIYCIQQDEQGLLWLGTGKGLASLDPVQGSFRSYGPEDGLQSNQFFQYSCGKGPDGELFFGGPNGLNAFHPKSLVNSTYTPPVVFTELQIFNQIVTPGSELLPHPINLMEELVLPYDQNVLTFEFAALNYQNTVKNLYQYRMVGFDKDWSPPQARHRATYTNLAPGKYTLQVRASNHDGIWNDTPRSLRVVIRPPFWQTPAFQAGLVILALGVTIATVQFRFYRIHKQNRELETRVRERTQALSNTNRLLQEEIRRRADAEAGLLQAKEAAESANQAKSAFLATMSHELRTPLHVMLGYTDLTSRQQGLPEAQREHLGSIMRSGEHLLTLINDVLDLSKIEAGRLELNEQTFDLHHMLKDLEDMFRLRAGQKALALCFEIAPNLPRLVRADEVRLRQVLINLIGNAVKFTTTGSVTVHAWVAPEDTDPFTPPATTTEVPAEPIKPVMRLTFQIVDTGPGIAANEIPDLFQNFSQAQAGRHSRQGTGLGLALVQRFSRLMGGDVRVESQPGKGATFTVSVQAGLPFQTTSPEALSQPDSNGPAEPGAVPIEPSGPPSPVYRLLIVDDDPDNRRLLLTTLRTLAVHTYRFELREAADGLRALEIWEQWQPHLIWLDLRMPAMDGYEVARRIREHVHGQEVRIVALSASALDNERAGILAAGCDAVLLKPVRSQEIFDCLSSQLGITSTPAGGEPADLISRPGPTGADRYETGSPAPGAPLLDLALVEGAPLPPSLAAELKRAALRTDPEKIRALLDAVHEINPSISAILKDFVQQYNYEMILSLLDRFLINDDAGKTVSNQATDRPSSHPEERE